MDTPQDTAHLREEEIEALARGTAADDLRWYAVEHCRRCSSCEKALATKRKEKGDG